MVRCCSVTTKSSGRVSRGPQDSTHKCGKCDACCECPRCGKAGCALYSQCYRSGRCGEQEECDEDENTEMPGFTVLRREQWEGEAHADEGTCTSGPPSRGSMNLSDEDDEDMPIPYIP